MCGINGFNWQSQDLIAKMNNKIQHRGPDDQGIFLAPDFSLGHCRLSILDLSPKGKQPMTYKNLTVVFNGEIYNFLELKAELEKSGYQFTSQSDTEVVLKAYHAWGREAIKKFNGIFALAIFDNQKQELFFARDQLGIKPFYYYQHQGKFIFSSEIIGLLAHRDIDRSIVPERLSFIIKLSCLPGDLTMFKYIHQLPAAHWGIWRDQKLTLERYWQPQDFSNINNYQEAQGRLRELLTDAVRRQLISDVPVGVFLSGGIDSSIIAQLAAQLSSKKIKTFSVGFEVAYGEEKYNADFRLAKRTADYLGADHHEVLIKSGQVLDYMKLMAEKIDWPNAMTTSVPSFWLSKFAKEQVSVVLGGDGGDELFGGYPRYQLSLYVSWWRKLPAPLRKKILPQLLAGLGRGSAVQRLNQTSDLSRYVDLKCHQEADAFKVAKTIYQPQLVDDYLLANYFSAALPTDDFEKYFMWVDTQTWLVDHSLIRTDKTTMNFGLEERVPLLDVRLAELSLRIPSRFKVDFWRTKKILKDAFRSELPSYLFNQPKRGWLSPASQWLRGELKDFAQDVLSESYVPESQEFFDFREVAKILSGHLSGEKYNLHLIWILLTWQLWYKNILKS